VEVTDADKHSSLLVTELITAVKSFKVQAREESFTKLDSTGKIAALLANIRLGWKWMPVKNTLAYYDTELITAVKKFQVQAKRSPLWSLILWVKYQPCSQILD
jgi:hypothetical protein